MVEVLKRRIIMLVKASDNYEKMEIVYRFVRRYLD